MKITTYGFELGKEKSKTNFFDSLTKTSNHVFKYGSFERILNCHKHKDFYLGILVTISDQRGFCLLKRDASGFLVSKEDLEKNENLMNFNFFIWNEKSKRGLFQEYYRAANISTFSKILEYKYNDFCDKELQDLTGDEKSKERKAMGLLDFATLVTGQGFYKELAELDKINNFEFYVLDDAQAIETFVPNAQDYIQSDKRKVVFKRSFVTRISSCVSIIREALNSAGSNKASVSGKTKDGHKRSIKMDTDKNKSFFREEDFDSLLTSLGEFELAKFEKSQAISNLLELAVEKSHIFIKEE